MTLLGSLGGFFFKKCTAGNSLSSTVRGPYLYIGVSFYVAGAVLNIVVLKFMPYSVVLPMTAITYVWTMVLSYFFLKEKMTINKIIGIVSILSGAVLIGVS